MDFQLINSPICGQGGQTAWMSFMVGPLAGGGGFARGGFGIEMRLFEFQHLDSEGGREE